MGEDKHIRPSWDEYYLAMLPLIGIRATCNRGRSGALIVGTKKNIIGAGYVGSPSGLPHCDEVGHEFNYVSKDEGKTYSKHCVRTVHAEMNAIFNAAKAGSKLDGATMYCNMAPCKRCAMAIIQVGIKRVIARNDYQTAAKGMLAEAGVALRVMGGELEYSKADKK